MLSTAPPCEQKIKRTWRRGVWGARGGVYRGSIIAICKEASVVWCGRLLGGWGGVGVWSYCVWGGGVCRDRWSPEHRDYDGC